MNKLYSEIKYLNYMSQFADLTGDYKAADECTEYLIKISQFQNQNLRTAGWNPAKMLGLEKAFNWIKEQGKKLDRWVREKFPGGWTGVIITAIAVAGVPGVNAGKFLEGANRLIAKGLDPIATMMKSDNPLTRAVGEAAFNTVLGTAQAALSKPGGGVDSSGYSPIGSTSSPEFQSIFDQYRAFSSGIGSGKKNRLQQLKSELYAVGRDKDALKAAWNNFISRGLKAYNDTVAARPEEKISDADLREIKAEIKKQFNVDL